MCELNYTRDLKKKQWLGITFQQQRGKRKNSAKKNSAKDSVVIRSLGFSLIESQSLEACIIYNKMEERL